MDAEYVSLDSVVPDMEDLDTQGPTLDQRFYDRLAVALVERLKQCGSRVPVVTGMFACCWETCLHSQFLKASLAQCLDHYSGKWGEVILTFVLRYWPLV